MTSPETPVDLVSYDTADALREGQLVRAASEVCSVQRTEHAVTVHLAHLDGLTVVIPLEVAGEAPEAVEAGAFLHVTGRLRRDGVTVRVVADSVLRVRDREGDFPPLVDAAHVVGFDHRGRRHAIEHRDAAAAISAAAEKGHPRCPRAFPVCRAGQVTVVPKLGAFDRATNPQLHARQVCPTCAWTIALETGRTDIELRALTPAAADVEPLRRRLTDPRLAVRLAETILAAALKPGYDYDLTHPHTVALLAAVTAHAPTLLVPEECAESTHGCADRPEDLNTENTTWHCPDSSVACPACSLRAGSWAGEWEGTFLSECTVAAPCEVLRTLATHFVAPLNAGGHQPEQDTLAAAIRRLRGDTARAAWALYPPDDGTDKDDTTIREIAIDLRRVLAAAEAAAPRTTSWPADPHVEDAARAIARVADVEDDWQAYVAEARAALTAVVPTSARQDESPGGARR